MAVHSAPRQPLHLVVSPAAAAQERRDRRAHHRRTLAELPWLHEIRLKYGPRAVLIDLSVGGAQVEAADARLIPGSTIVVEIAGRRDESVIPSRVVRCQMIGASPQPIYRAALEFTRTLTLPDTRGASPLADANPRNEHARLLLTLERLETNRFRSSDERPVADGIHDLAAVLAMIDTPAARRAGRAFTRELAALLSIVRQGIEEDAPQDTLVDRLVERLRRTIPMAALRITDTLAMSHSDVVYFDVPHSGTASPAKLLVEFPRDYRFQEWQFQYLKAAAHVFAFVREVAARRASSLQVTAVRKASAEQRAGE